MNTMTPEAKRRLSATIRELRERLLRDLRDATEAAYRLSIHMKDAELSEGARARRKRLEEWINEQIRAQANGGSKSKKQSRTRDDFRHEAEKQAAYTLLNRLVLLRLMEEPGPTGKALRAPALIKGGWESRAYLDFRELAPGLVRDDESEGYALLLRLAFEDLAGDLPGLYGPAGIADLIPIPAATLRAAVDALNVSELESCWGDDMTLGWVYQYWNDPEREAIDAKLNDGGKVEPHELASKTQLFTERYMVDWLLQNSLSPMWLAMCKKHGWTPEVERDGVLRALEERRADWRAKREAGEVELTELMPLHSDAERRWAYYVPQDISDAAAESAPESIRDLTLIDPAVGSGHFLVGALSLLFPLYQEEARHRGEANDERWSDQAIVERILEHNLSGIDIDPRAVQIAAASLWLKAHHLSPEAKPERLNLVASNLRLASLPDDDAALVELRSEIERETGIPADLTNSLVNALRGADHLGSLLKIDEALEETLRQHEGELGKLKREQGGLFSGFKEKPERASLSREDARASLLALIERFLAKLSSGDDLGLRLRGEQLAAGVRFIRMLREGSYDLVVANPPYLATKSLAQNSYLAKHYSEGKADLYAAFLLRGLELVREGGVSAMLTMRGWMFIKTYSALREIVFSTHGLRAIGDFGQGAFEHLGASFVAPSASVIFRELSGPTVALKVDHYKSGIQFSEEKRAATLCHEGRHDFDPKALKIIPEWPLVYWWDEEMLRLYQSAPLIGEVSPGRAAQSTGDNPRFTRLVWEITRVTGQFAAYPTAWFPFINGGKGREWFEELREVANWAAWGLPVKSSKCHKTGVETCSLASEEYFARNRGVAFSMIGANFSARVHRYPSIFGDMGSSIFPDDLAGAVCAMNATRSRDILESLNPGVHFQVGDVNRLPLFPIEGSDAIFARIEAAFDVHEAHREPSVEFKRPGPSPWRYAQEWAQRAVDRPAGEPLPEYAEELDAEPASDHLSFALGVALGRFGAAGSAQEGVLDPRAADLSHALPHGILFLDTTLGDEDDRDGLGHPAAAPLHAAWAEYGHAIGTKRGLRAWLALDFFKDVHRTMYENRPIHFPLSSPSRTFVAWVNIHRFDEQTLRVLLADHLMPTRARLEGEIADLRAIRDGGDKKAARDAETQLARSMKALDELELFIANVEQCAEQGAPPTDAKCPPREVDARYAPVLDDGVMINSAGLWPLLDPQWKEPKKWWKELATASGRKDYDWSHLAMRYFPTRVDKKCQDDPSLGVAHGCFWRYHPERAWAWELRLQDEIGTEFRIDEAPYQPGGRDLGDEGSDAHRSRYLEEHVESALAAIEKEAIRRMGRGKEKTVVREFRLLEPGLWTANAEALWQLEWTLSERQDAELRIVAPDEEVMRKAYEDAHPEERSRREAYMKGLESVREIEYVGHEDVRHGGRASEES